MHNDEILFLTILFSNLFLLSLVYVFYCNYYNIRLADFYHDVILASAFLISIPVYYKIINGKSNQIANLDYSYI
jgi:hypothetical protein